MKFVILGEPTPKGRPLISAFRGFARAYTPEKTRIAEGNLRGQLVHQLPEGFVPFSTPLDIVIDIFRSKPKSISKKVIHPGKKPDLDNYIKTVLDAMNSVVFDDDALICSIVASKQYSDRPRIEVEIKEKEGITSPLQT